VIAGLAPIARAVPAEHWLGNERKARGGKGQRLESAAALERRFRVGNAYPAGQEQITG